MFTLGDKRFDANPLKKIGVSFKCPVVFAHAHTHFTGVLNCLLRAFVLPKNKPVDFCPIVLGFLGSWGMESLFALGGGQWEVELLGLIKWTDDQEVIQMIPGRSKGSLTGCLLR